jgi:hypothetical protein
VLEAMIFVTAPRGVLLDTGEPAVPCRSAPATACHIAWGEHGHVPHPERGRAGRRRLFLQFFNEARLRSVGQGRRRRRRIVGRPPRRMPFERWAGCSRVYARTRKRPASTTRIALLRAQHALPGGCVRDVHIACAPTAPTRRATPIKSGSGRRSLRPDRATRSSARSTARCIRVARTKTAPPTGPSTVSTPSRASLVAPLRARRSGRRCS